MGKKMNKPDPSAASDGGGFDMTSMIDVTFLLLIFFMTCTQLSDTSKSKMEPVRVENGEPDSEVDPEGRLLINVLKDGNIQINSKDFTPPELNETLKKHHALSVASGAGASNKQIMIRADKRTKYKDVQSVMQMCMDNRFWRITFAALGVDPSKPE